MIVPSIDLMNGEAVQLVGGKEKALSAGDPRPIAERFGRVGEVAVIDLDAALGTGSNAAVIEELLAIAPCRVGGGIRSVEAAVRWLDAGASKVILGTAARPEILAELPRERVIAAVDAMNNEVVTEGWTKHEGVAVEQRIDELREFVSGFLVTFVEREGRLQGLPIDRVRALVERAGAGCRVTVAGGVREPSDIRDADEAGADAQVGMALYTGRFDLAEGLCAPLRTDRGDGLWPTVVCDERGAALGLVYSSVESVLAALETGTGVYFSRSRNEIWHKGRSSGNTQELIRIDVDCDRDALRFVVRQCGDGFCHLGDATCFGGRSGLAALDRTLEARRADAPVGSYTQRLFNEPDLLGSKLTEEARELAGAGDRAEAAWEAADLIYFALVAARRHGASLRDIETELDRRALRITRRPGNAKPSVEA